MNNDQAEYVSRYVACQQQTFEMATVSYEISTAYNKRKLNYINVTTKTKVGTNMRAEHKQ